MKDIFGEVKEVRPGRHLFVRERLLGVEDIDNNNNKAETPDKKRTTITTSAVDVDLQIVVQHGSCATEAQFHSLFQALDSLLLQYYYDGPSSSSSNNKQQQMMLCVRCILYDMVGCGQSPVLPAWEAYNGEELEKDLGAIVEQYTDPSLPLCIISHSYGPNIVIRWLNNNNLLPKKKKMENIMGFIFLGACIRVDASRPYPDGGHPIFILPLFLLNYLQTTMTKDFVDKAIHPSHEDIKKACLEGSNQNNMFMVKAFYRQTKWATSDELVKAVGDKPVLHIHGVSDGIVEIAWGQHLVNQLPHKEKVEFVPMEEASHLVMMEKPDDVARKICDFLVACKTQQQH